jgi:hypothetical protein
MKINFGPLSQKGVISEAIASMDFEFALKEPHAIGAILKNQSRVSNQKSAWCKLSTKIMIQILPD